MREFTMERSNTFFHRYTRPQLQGSVTGKELNMVWKKYTRQLIERNQLLPKKYLSTNMLNFIFGEVQCLCYDLVSEISDRIDLGCDSSVSDKKNCFTKLIFFLFVHTLILHFIWYLKYYEKLK